ncbi:hypothetical protein GR702_09660 [Novosphingobium sp. FGD1]|uniref:Peptidase inhibitor I78 n=1 Tax=Novosphingobium silvae TaxID=2692619 RepID=A0A7X4GG71_9SPHN|nr:I78 family peptidase inhibitor [Novosphingobium silvae]MYL98037.1 hypothetical protein [Novosphingobium silvae]
MTLPAKSFVASSLLAMALGACTGAQPEASLPAPPMEEPACGADQLGSYLGRKATDEVIAAIQAWRGKSPVRVLKPGSVMTMDYRPDRLNIEVDAQGTITRFRCT